MHRTKVHVHSLNDKYKQMILNDLGAGPVAFGEEHKSPHARQMIEMVIQAGAVQQLFLEVPNLGCNTKLAQASQQKDARSVAVELEIAAARVSGIRCPEFPWKRLMRFAIEQGVELHLFDVAEWTEGQMRSKNGLTERDQYMASYYKANVKNAGKGALLLNGAKHLTSKNGYSGQSLASLCGIWRVYLFTWSKEGVRTRTA